MYPDYPYKKVRKMINKLYSKENITLKSVIDKNLCKFCDGSFDHYHIDKERFDYIMQYEVGLFKSKKKTHQ